MFMVRMALCLPSFGLTFFCLFSMMGGRVVMPGFARRLLIQPLNIMSKIDVGGNVFPAGGDALFGVFFLFHDQFKPLADTGSRFIVYLFNQVFRLSCFQGLVGGRDDGLNGFPGFEPGIRGAFPGPVNPDQGSKKVPLGLFFYRRGFGFGRQGPAEGSFEPLSPGPA